MPVLFSQKYSEDIKFDNLSHVEFLALALETSKSLGWVIGNYYDNGFRAYTQNGIFNWNAEFIVKIYKSTGHLLSQSNNIRIMEPENDKANVKRFIAIFNSLKQTMYPGLNITAAARVHQI